MGFEKLSNATVAALAADLAKEAKRRRAGLAPGTYEVAETVTLDVNGTVAVGEDEDYVPTASIPLKPALALFCRYAGVTGPAAMNALTRAMKEAFAMDRLTGKAKKAAYAAITELADLNAAEATVRKGLDALPDATRNGKVKFTAKTAAEVEKEAA